MSADSRKVVRPVRFGNTELDWSRTYVMGVINVTPDSFSDGGRFYSAEAAVRQGESMVSQGADILDVGGESTRPGADPVSVRDEIDRVLPVIRELTGTVRVPVSIDTYKAEVAAAAVRAGAGCINDVSGLTLDPELAHVAAETGVPLVVGHIRGDPKTMQSRTQYDDCLSEVIDVLGVCVEAARAAGVRDRNILVDPGIGFGKTAEQNLELILGSGRIRAALKKAVLVGPSRKSFIGKLTGAEVDDRLPGTIAACTAAVFSGADLVRVHDVAPVLQAARLSDAFRAAAGR